MSLLDILSPLTATFNFLSVMLLTSLSEVTYVFVLSWHSTSFFFHVLWFCFHIIQLQTFSLILWYTTNSPSSPIFLSVPLDLQPVRAAMKKGLEEACARAALPLLGAVFGLRLLPLVPTWAPSQWHHSHEHPWSWTWLIQARTLANRLT